MRNGKVYLSAPAGNPAAVVSLLAARKAKKLDLWRGPVASDDLSLEATHELAERDTLIRVLDKDTAAAAQMRLELAEFHRLCELDAQNGAPGRRVIVNLIADEAYQPQPEDATAQFTITTFNKPESAWLPTILSEAGQLKMATKYVNSPLFVLSMVGLACVVAILGLWALTDLGVILFWLR